MRYAFALVVSVVLLSAPAASADPAQDGLTGWLEMRTPDITTNPEAYGALRTARMDKGIGNHTYIKAGYQQAWSEDGEWGVQVPLAITRAGSGLHQLFAGGKYRFVNSESFDLAATGYLLLPGNAGATETGTGQLGLGGEFEMLIEQSGVQLAIDGGVGRADYCNGCPRPGYVPKGKAVTSLDGAVGLRVPIDVHAVVAEYHVTWSNRAAGPKIDDSDMYAQIGGNFGITDKISAKPFLGKGFGFKGVSKNTDIFGGVTGAYDF